MCEQSQCIKFEYEGMKTAGVTDTASVFQMDKISMFNKPKKEKKENSYQI